MKTNDIAVKHITNTLAIIIDNIDEIEEKVIYRLTSDNKQHKTKLYYTTKGLPFFCFNGIRYYLHDFMRI